MSFSGFQGSSKHNAALSPADNGKELPKGPQPSSRWECPARYEINHKHQDGRPLCRYCECWNPAPFPNGSMPIQPARSSTTVLPPTSISHIYPQFTPLESDTREQQNPLEMGTSMLYSGYNLPPAPESISSPNLVCLAPFSILVFLPFKNFTTNSILLPQLSHLPSQFPSLKSNASRVEQSRLPSKLASKTGLQYSSRKLPSSSNTLTRFPLPGAPPLASTSKVKPLAPDVATSHALQWQLQVICGPGHDHNNFDSQRAGIKFKRFEFIGEQIWRPSILILDEEVQSPTISTSLDWPDFLRFRVLDTTTPWEQWSSLYSKEHHGRKPLMRDCYLTHGWNKQTKSPIWLPQEVRSSGSLRSILLQWFSSSKDKVTIVFEYINKDLARTDTTVSERLSDLSLVLSDPSLPETISSDSPIPLPTLQSSSSYQLHSSPPQLTTRVVTAQRIISHLPTRPSLLTTTQNSNYLEDSGNLVQTDSMDSSSSDFEFPTIQQLIATTTTLIPDNHTMLTTLDLHPPISDSSSSPLSTIPDTPEKLLSPLILPPSNINTTTTQMALRSSSKVSYTHSIFFSSFVFFRTLPLFEKYS